MSGKFENKKKPSTKTAAGSQKKKAGSKSRVRRGLWIAIAISVVVLCLLIAYLFSLSQGESTILPELPTETTATEPGESSGETKATEPALMEQIQELSMNLGFGLEIQDVGKYSGIYMEDRTDEIVSGILMIVVHNTGGSDIQYAEITLSVGNQSAFFTVSTLPAGKSVVLLEKNRMAYDASADYSGAVANNVAWFPEPLSLCEDKLNIQILDGGINISNISGEDITGDVVIYYKNSSSDMLYGGITYRATISGGLKADEIRQIMAEHFSSSGSTILFITCGS